MENMRSQFQPVAGNLEAEKALKKFRFVGLLGFIIYAIGAVSVAIFAVTAIALSLLPISESSAIQNRVFEGHVLQGPDLLKLGALSLLTLPVNVVWCWIFRRFKPAMLLTTRTANLLCSALILSLPACLASGEFGHWTGLLNLKLGGDPASLGGRLTESAVFWLWDALPLLAFFWVFRLSVFLKQESDSTI